MGPLVTSDLAWRARTVVEREAEAVAGLADLEGEMLLLVVQTLLECSGHVLVTGAGTSAAVAQRFAHLLSCCGTPALYISASECLHGGAGAIRPDDVVFLISKGGRSDEINQVADLARQRGAKVIAQTEDAGAPLAHKADSLYLLSSPAEADLYGMIALGSSLVHCVAGDVLCALLLDLRGYSREEFGRTHPAGAVGKRLADEATAGA